MKLLTVLIHLLSLVFKVLSVKLRYYPLYHLAPPKGWMNDPNGFSKFGNDYHLFYQYNPFSSLTPGIANWGHARSTDLMTWEHLPVAIKPDQDYDKDGAFSGSAIIEENKMHVFYTGNKKQPDKFPKKLGQQAYAYSLDGINFTKYDGNPIIKSPDLQPNIRDPKVWKYNERYYMVIGHENENQHGEVILFSSLDKYNWDQVTVLAKSNGTLGFMWETPDFFELDGKYILMFCPQGVKSQGYRFLNLYQAGYFVGSFSYSTNEFTIESDFQQIDEGHDYYAIQTMYDGRRILIAWMDMWNEDYPEGVDGFTGQMTLPREITLGKNNRLLQNPIKEVEVGHDNVLHSGGNPNRKIKLPNKTGRIVITADLCEHVVIVISSASGKYNTVKIQYDVEKNIMILDRGGRDSTRLHDWKPENLLKWRIYVDSSSIEVFCGDGELVFSSRYFPNDEVFVEITKGQVKTFEVTSFKRTIPLPENPQY